jgi:hypothetical protein
VKNLGVLLDDFVRPLVTGGELLVRAPVDRERIDGWTQEIDRHSQATGPIDDAREALAAELLVRPPRLLFGEVELRLAAAIYDAFALAHPKFDGFPTGRKARERVIAHALAIAEVPEPAERDEWVARHTLLHNLLDVTRVDVSLRWWTGRAEYRGQKPPGRLTAWPSLRRVRQEREVVRLHELCLALRGVPIEVVARVLEASPLTDLLQPARPLPHFEWTPRLVRLLGDVELSRVVAYRWLGDEPDSARLGSHPAAAANALSRQLEPPAADRPPALSRPELVAVCQLLIHISVLLALAEARAERSLAPSPLLREVLEGARLDAEHDGLTTLLALPDAAARVDPARFTPPGLEAEPVAFSRWKAHRAQIRAACEDARLDKLASRLQARLA